MFIDGLKSVRSARIAAAVFALVWGVLTLLPGLGVVGVEEAGLVAWDKVAHAGAMAVLTGLLVASRLGGRGASLRTHALLAAVAGLAYGGADEWLQGWTGRDASAADMAANAVGVLGVYLVVMAGRERSLTRRWYQTTWLVWAVRVACVSVLPAVYYLLTTKGPAADWAKGWLEAGAIGQWVGDKAGHWWLGLVATWALAAMAVAGRSRPRWSAGSAVVAASASAVAIEWGQQFYDRGVEVADVWAHHRGMVTAMGVWAMAVAASPVLPGVWRGVGVATGLGEAGAKPQAGVGGEGGPERGFVRDAAVVSGLTLLSRVTGLVRDAVLAAVLGLSWVADAFFLAFLIPNLFRRLFGEGALTAAFIPQYTKLLERDPSLARRFASLNLGLLTLGLGLLTLLGEAVLWGLASLGGWSEKSSLAIRLTMVMLPYMPLICLVALVGGVLQVHRRFGPPAAVPVVLNLVMIAAAAWAGWDAADVGGEFSQRWVAWVTAWSVVGAGGLQVVWQVAALGRVEALTLRWGGTGGATRAMLRMMGPMVLGLAVFQVNALLDSLIAFGLSAGDGGGSAKPQAMGFEVLGRVVAYPIDSGAVAALQWAQRLYQFPLGVFGIAIATAIFPALAGAAAREGAREGGGSEAGTGRLKSARLGESGEGFVEIVRRGLRLTVFIALPAGVGLILVREPLVRTVYERGQFDAADSVRVASILAGYAASIWAYAMTHVLTRAFYAREDAATPLRVSLAMVGLNLVLNLTLIWPLGAAGLAWSTAISGAGQAGLLVWVLGRRKLR